VHGRSSLDVIHVDNATVSSLAEPVRHVMLTVGMHVPLRDRRLRRALGPGALAAGVVAITAPLGGLGVAELTGIDRLEQGAATGTQIADQVVRTGASCRPRIEVGHQGRPWSVSQVSIYDS
jgi:hypothetical protein